MNFATHSMLCSFCFLYLSPLRDFLNAYPSLMYSLLLATGLAHYNHFKYNFRTIANRVIFVKTVSRKYMSRGKIIVSLPLISANRSVHGLGKCYSKFRTSRFHPGIAFTIGTNQFHLPENGRENLKLISNVAFEEMEHDFSFVWNILSGKTGLPFQKFRCPENSTMKRLKKSCSIYFPTGFPGRFLWMVNKPCPWSRSGHWHGEEKNDGEYNARGLLDISLGGEVRLGLSYPDPVWFSYPV